MIGYLYLRNIGVAANTIVYCPLESNGNDQTVNNFNLVTNGTIPFTFKAGGPGGFNASGPYSDTNYFSASASLNTALSNQQQLFIQFYVYLNSIANLPVLFWFTATGADANGIFLQCSPSAGNNTISLYNAGHHISADNVLKVGGWYHVAVLMRHSSIGTTKVWCSPLENISQTPVLNFSQAFTITNVSNFTLGRFLLAGSFGVNGNIKNFRVSNVDMGRIPTLN